MTNRPGTAPRRAARAKDTTAYLAAVADRTLRGDSVDVATGWVVLRQKDLQLAGALALTLSRVHVSGYRLGRWFGASWASTVDQRVAVDGDGLRLVLEDATVLTYPIPVNGSEVLPISGPRLPLRHVEGGYQVVVPGDGRVLNFGADGGDTYPIRSIVDASGNRVVFRYDGTDTLVAIEHSGGYRLGVETAGGLITAIHLRGTEVARYRYGNGRLMEIIDGTCFTYDDEGRITRRDDSDGRWYRYRFDARGRVTRAEGSGGYLNLALAYEPGTTTVTDSLGNATRYRLDDRLRVVAETDPLGATTRYERDERGLLLASTDALGHVTRYDRDAAGNVLAETGPDGRKVIREYDDHGRLLTTIGPDGAVWRRAYDRRGRLVRTTDPAGAVTTYTYDAGGNLDTVTDPLGGVTRVECDAAGLPVRVTDPVGAVTTHDYDGLGHPKRITDPLGNVTRMTCSPSGEPRVRVDPDGTVWRWHEGSTVDSRGGETMSEYGPFGQLVARTRSDGGRVCYAYDTELRLVSVTDEEGRVRRHAYDAAGNLVSETDHKGRTVRCGYDAAGRLVLLVYDSGDTVAFDRDAAGRVVRRRAGDDVATFAYDRAGRLTMARNADAEVVFTYDELGRVVAESINGRTVRSEYDLAGRRTVRRTPSGAESRFVYDAAHRPVALHTAGRTMYFEHDLGGRELVRRLADVELCQSWDAAGRLVTQTVRGNGRTVRHREYGYLPADRCSDDGHDDRLTGVVTPDGRRWRYRYDALGRRIAKQRLDGADRIVEQTQFTWDGTHLAEEVRSGAGTAVALVWEWAPGTDRVITQTRRVLGQDGSDFHAVVTDLAGAPTELVDEAGTVAWQARVSLWGTMSPRAYIPLRLPGHYHDEETGLSHRYHDPDVTDPCRWADGVVQCASASRGDWTVHEGHGEGGPCPVGRRRLSCCRGR